MQRRDVPSVIAPAREPAAMNFSFRQRSGKSIEDRRAERQRVRVVRLGMEALSKKLLPIFRIATTPAEHIRLARRFAHRDVDHDDKFQRPQRFAHPRAVGDRVRRIFALHEHRAKPLPDGRSGFHRESRWPDNPADDAIHTGLGRRERAAEHPVDSCRIHAQPCRRFQSPRTEASPGTESACMKRLLNTEIS